jgi:hypothetical protein
LATSIAILFKVGFFSDLTQGPINSSFDKVAPINSLSFYNREKLLKLPVIGLFVGNGKLDHQDESSPPEKFFGLLTPLNRFLIGQRS